MRASRHLTVPESADPCSAPTRCGACFPAFWALPAAAVPVEVLAHRIAWTAVLTAVALTALGAGASCASCGGGAGRRHRSRPRHHRPPHRRVGRVGPVSGSTVGGRPAIRRRACRAGTTDSRSHLPGPCIIARRTPSMLRTRGSAGRDRALLSATCPALEFVAYDVGERDSTQHHVNIIVVCVPSPVDTGTSFDPEKLSGAAAIRRTAGLPPCSIDDVPHRSMHLHELGSFSGVERHTHNAIVE